MIQIELNTYTDLHNEWVGSLLAYEDELRNIRHHIAQLQSSVNDFQFQHNLHELAHEVDGMKMDMDELSKEVLCFRNKVAKQKSDTGVMFVTMLENNRLREKIRKAEQAVFMLKFQLGKFLSKAS